MKVAYIDTNILLARWIESDPFHKESVLVVKAVENAKIQAYFSTFGLCEIISVVKRQEQKFSEKIQGAKSNSLSYMKKIRNINNIIIYNDNNQVRVNIGKKETEISLSYWTAINIGAKTGLKTLDNIHIAIAKVISTVTKDIIHYFITADDGILQKAKIIKNLYDISVINPDVLIQLEGL